MRAADSIQTGLVYRPAEQRFHTQLDWLDSWHTFSFASHVDPSWMGFGPLRVINDDTIAPGRGFGMHPHRDMEIITVMVEGQLHHHDSMGHHTILRAGEVQRMSAGTGIVHSEMNEGDAPCRLLQIWIEPSTDGLPPSYEQQPFPQEGEWTLLLDPDRREGAMSIHRAVRLWRASLRPGQSLPVSLSTHPFGWIQMMAGDVQLRPRDSQDPLRLRRGDGLGFAASAFSTDIVLAGPEGADLLCFAFEA